MPLDTQDLSDWCRTLEDWHYETERKLRYLTVALVFFFVFSGVAVLSIAVDFRSSMTIVSAFFAAIAAAAITAVVLFRKER